MQSSELRSTSPEHRDSTCRSCLQHHDRKVPLAALRAAASEARLTVQVLAPAQVHAHEGRCTGPGRLSAGTPRVLLPKTTGLPRKRGRRR